MSIDTKHAAMSTPQTDEEQEHQDQEDQDQEDQDQDEEEAQSPYSVREKEGKSSPVRVYNLKKIDNYHRRSKRNSHS